MESIVIEVTLNKRKPHSSLSEEWLGCVYIPTHISLTLVLLSLDVLVGPFSLSSGSD